jgi:hypothetical protein
MLTSAMSFVTGGITQKGFDTPPVQQKAGQKCSGQLFKIVMTNDKT